MDVKNFTCISCPMGCRLMVFEDTEDNELKVTGNRCKRGITFAKDEFYSPKRIITTVLSMEDDDKEFLPVISDGGVPREKVWDCIHFLQEIQVKKPILAGEIIIRNILDTNVNIIASKSIL